MEISIARWIRYSICFIFYPLSLILYQKRKDNSKISLTAGQYYWLRLTIYHVSLNLCSSHPRRSQDRKPLHQENPEIELHIGECLYQYFYLNLRQDLVKSNSKRALSGLSMHIFQFWDIFLIFYLLQS